MEEEDLVYINQLEAENEQLKSQSGALRSAVTNSNMFNDETRNNITWQIDTDKTLEKIEHFLRADVPAVDKKGNLYYEKQENPDLILLNEYGISNIMRIFSNYISKEHILSFYPSEDRINEMLADLGHELRRWIFCNYEKMGLDTAYKKSSFPLLVLNCLHDVESTLRRALHGKQMEEINTGRIVTETHGLGGPNSNYNPINKPKKWYNRFT